MRKFSQIFRNRFLLRSYLIVGFVGLSIFFVMYNNVLIQKLHEETNLLSMIYIKFLSSASDPNIEGELMRFIFEEVVQKADYPIIITDANGYPQFWKNLSIPAEKNYAQLNSFEKLELQRWLVRIQHDNQPICIQSPMNDRVLEIVYYGDSPTVHRLKFLPYLEIFLIASFFTIGFVIFYMLKGDEKKSIWIGMAKETAHQLGTPITSLLGWIELAKENEKLGNCQEFHEICSAMESNLQRLTQIASRFSKIGSKPELKPHDFSAIVNEVVDYYEQKYGRFKSRIAFEKNIEPDLHLRLDPELIKWMLENFIKNSLEAMSDRKRGKIWVQVYSNRKCVILRVEDEGHGILPGFAQKIFDVGFSTKKRGWGIGLSLCRRIVEEYHRGKLRLVNTSERGTTFEVHLPFNLEKDYFTL